MNSTKTLLAFPAAEYQRRLVRVRKRMAERGLDVALICIPQNYYYLTGFQTGGSHGLLFLVLPREGEGLWITRKTEMSNVRALAPAMWVGKGIGVDDSEDFIEVLVRALLERGYERASIGYEGEALSLTIAQFAKLGSLMRDARFEDMTGLIEHERRIKSPVELDFMRRAGKMASGAIAASFETLVENTTTAELAAVMLGSAIRAGSDRMGTLPYVSSGPRTYRAHASWSEDPIAAGEVVNAEMAASFRHYHVPLFRVFSIGEPSREIRRMHDASEAGLYAGLQTIRAGMTSHEADTVVRSAITRAGYGEAFVVRAAYGIGVAFSPTWGETAVMNIRPGEERELEAGMCFHLVPAIYVEGVGCVCCSMPLVITQTSVERLSSLEPKLYIRA